MHELLILLFLCAQLSFYWLNCVCLNPQVFSLLCPQFTARPMVGMGVCICLGLSCLLGLNCSSWVPCVQGTCELCGVTQWKSYFHQPGLKMLGSTCASQAGMGVSLEVGWPSALCHPITPFFLLGFRLFDPTERHMPATIIWVLINTEGTAEGRAEDVSCLGWGDR